MFGIPTTKEDFMLRHFAALIISVALGAACVPAGAEEAKAAPAKVDTVSGEVIDLACYLGHGASGKEHAQCAKTCIKGGLPVGIKTATGIILAVGKDHKTANAKLAPLAGEMVVATGELSEQDGLKLITLATVAKQK